MRAMTRGRLVAPAAGLLAVLGLLGGCQSDDNGERDTGGAPEERAASPFTGEELPDGPQPVLALKIDNVETARPQTGLEAADIVYVEPVEAGLTRLLTIFSSELPDQVGPVRSGRESDLELLRQFGEPAFAYSGVQSRLLPVFAEAPLYPVTPDLVPDAYERAGDRPAPHNLYADPAALLDAAPDASEASGIGFRFGDAPADGGAPFGRYEVAFPSASFTFSWSEEDARWEVALDGEDSGLQAATVVVQEVTIRDSRFHDSAGSVTPYTETTGSGRATVLRDGQAFEAEWSRPSPDDGTEFTTPDGEPMRFAPGQVWVLFQERTG
ncbi:DUF3048 domain-containing protein [Streptomyces sp. 7-21]|nr:DUF3048 domain-containing protein [Streptomyces sp. 7-21]